ncbi:MAG: hypothetical protein IT355_03935 [Gemmatimonadaceae bacterium]|nr:hypothetical protein [Gemmatimonadaceae bacterium]
MTILHTVTRRRAAMLVFLLAAVSGCDPLGSTARVKQFEAAESRWRSAGITSYRYVHSLSCFCVTHGSAEVTVIAGQVVRVVSREDGADEPVAYRPAVDSLFAFVRQQLRDDPGHLTVAYDPALGYPRQVKWGTPENDAGGFVGADSLVALR